MSSFQNKKKMIRRPCKTGFKNDGGWDGKGDISKFPNCFGKKTSIITTSTKLP